jgi:hypothetical protein
VGKPTGRQSVVAGTHYTCGIHEGNAYCWGRNSSGELGDSTTIGRLVPTRVGSDGDWQLLDAADDHTCGVRLGAVYCWGQNQEGQLGGGTTSDSLVPVQVGVQAALAAAGIAQRFSLHGFRRTFNSLLRQATTGEVVRSMTGQVTERMTEHYSHVATAEKHRAVLRALPTFEPRRPRKVGTKWGPPSNSTRDSPLRKERESATGEHRGPDSATKKPGSKNRADGAGEGIRTLDVNLGNALRDPETNSENER